MVQIVCRSGAHAVIEVTAGFQIVPIQGEGENASPRTDLKANFANFRELVEIAVMIARSDRFDATKLRLLPENLGSGAYRYLPLVGKIPEARHDEEWEARCNECFPEFLKEDGAVRARHQSIEIDDVKLVFAENGSISFEHPGQAPNPTWSAKGLALLWIFVLSDQRTEEATYTEMPNGEVYSPQYCPFLVRAIQQWGVPIQFQHFPEPEIAIHAGVSSPTVTKSTVAPKAESKPAQQQARSVPPPAPVVKSTVPSKIPSGDLVTPPPQAAWDIRARLRCENLVLEL